MSPTGNCPQCGATINFKHSISVQTTCPFCNSILVRSDIDLKKVGEVADLPNDISPVQLGTEGLFKGRGFTVTGRIIYEWDQGTWNEWHLIFSDGSTGWLSDAQAQYVVTFPRPPKGLPEHHEAWPGKKIQVDGRELEITNTTNANYKGVEGELPFEYWDKERVPFSDLRSTDGAFGTIDYSEVPPLLFVGEPVEFDELKLKNIRELTGKTVQAKALDCPSCGGSVELRAAEVSVSAVCTQCLSVLDTTRQSLVVIQTVRKKQRVKPLIPLGEVGHFRGTDYTNIGFQVRSIQVEGQKYSWREYVLFHPHQGFRYLSEYDGHWNFVKPLTHLPTPATSRGRKAMALFGETYAHFQGASATTDFVIGEFPWRVEVGERVFCDDYVSPPRMLSSETSDSEVTWSLGEYVTGADVWKAFKLTTPVPPAIGVYANQPAPVDQSAKRTWRNFLILAALLLVAVNVTSLFMSDKEVFRQKYRFDAANKGEASFVTPTFELKGRPANVEVRIETDLRDQWVYFNFALISETTGQGWDWGREVSYYSGSDWSEGDRNDSSLIGQVPAGRYYLRVEPDWEPQAGSTSVQSPVDYSIVVRRDVPRLWPYIIIFVLLLIPPIWASMRSFGFESKRWAESQYGTLSGIATESDD